MYNLTYYKLWYFCFNLQVYHSTEEILCFLAKQTFFVSLPLYQCKTLNVYIKTRKKYKIDRYYILSINLNALPYYSFVYSLIITTLLKLRKCLAPEVSDVIETCNYYYFQSIARHAVFQDAMCNPSKVHICPINVCVSFEHIICVDFIHTCSRSVY